MAVASIQTGIELQDNFSQVLFSMVGSVNLVISAMEEMNQSMSAGVDTARLEGARAAVDDVTMALHGMNAEMERQMTPPSVPQPSQPSEPAVPTWQADSLDVFTSSGIERFRQEVQSADDMMEQLLSSQQRIRQAAERVDVLPDGAVTDLNSMSQRMQALQAQMQRIASNPMNLGTDAANAGLEQMRQQLDRAVEEQNELNTAVENMDVEAMNAAYLRLSQTVGQAEGYIRDNTDEQGRFNQAVSEGGEMADSLLDTIKKAVAAYATIQTVGKALELSDEMTQTTARLDMMNDGLQTTQDLQNMIYLSAQRSRGVYQETADVVAKLGLMAGDAFASNEETIAFAEQLNKKFTIAGTSAEGVSAAMLQLTQAMGSGVLRGEEYNSILEQAPNIVQDIAKYIEGNEDVLGAVASAMGMSVEELAGNVKGNLKDIASEGLISAEMVKAAMFYTADETNQAFENMPMTWTQVFSSMKNTAMIAFQPVLQRLNDIANSPSFQNFVNGAIEAISILAGVMLDIFDLIAQVGTLISDNWSIISPIVYGVIGALAVYYGWQLTVNAISLVSKGIHMLMAAAQMIHAAATRALTRATATDIAAQNGLNSAMYACPIVWIIVLIIALIALFYAAVAAVNKFAGTSVSATGIICGVFMVAAAFVGNLIVTLINFAIDIFVVLWNFIAAFANFFGNVFNDPVGAIARLFFDLVDTILSLLQSLASAIDTVFGSDLAGSVQGWRDSLGGWVDETFGKGDEVMEKIDADDMKIGRFEYDEAWDTGYSFGEGIDESIANFDPSSLFEIDDIPDPDDYKDLSNYQPDYDMNAGVVSGIGEIADNTKDIKDSMEITSEELKYLRDIAEQETVNRFTTAEVHIVQNNNNSISSDMDLDGVVDGLTEAMNEAVDIATEGVHV